MAVLQKTLESPQESKEIKPVNLKGGQPWIFLGRTDAKAEAPIPCPPDVKRWLTGKKKKKKTLILVKTETKGEEGTEDEMFR